MRDTGTGSDILTTWNRHLRFTDDLIASTSGLWHGGAFCESTIGPFSGFPWSHGQYSTSDKII